MWHVSTHIHSNTWSDDADGYVDNKEHLAHVPCITFDEAKNIHKALHNVGAFDRRVEMTFEMNYAGVKQYIPHDILESIARDMFPQPTCPGKTMGTFAIQELLMAAAKLYPDQLIERIKFVRMITGFGLKAAKDLVQDGSIEKIEWTIKHG